MQFEKVVVPRPASEEDWLALRAKFSNCSSAAVHVREHEWLTIADWFVAKRTGATKAETRAMTRGKWRERSIVDQYAYEHDLVVSPLDVMFQCGRLLGTPDADIVNLPGRVGLEVKATLGRHSRRARFWQCVGLLACSDWDEVHLVEDGSEDYEVTVLRREDLTDEIDRLFEAIERDWGYLEAGTPPPDAVFDADQVFAVWPVPNVAKIDLPPRVVDLAKELKEARAEGRRGERRAEAAKNAIADLMVDGFTSAEVGMFNGEPLITYKANRPSKVFDEETFRRELPDLWARYTVEKPGARVMKVVGEPAAPKPTEEVPF